MALWLHTWEHGTIITVTIEASMSEDAHWRLQLWGCMNPTPRVPLSIHSGIAPAPDHTVSQTQARSHAALESYSQQKLPVYAVPC